MVMKSRIGYEVSVATGSAFQTFNCASNQWNEEKYVEASEEDVNKAAEIAHAAFFVYKKISDEIRAQFLEEIAHQLNQSRESLVRQFNKESSLSLERGNGELDRTIFQLQSFAALAKSGTWKQSLINLNLPNGSNIRTNHEPIGTVAVFGASNFPFAYSTVGGDTTAALAVGCPVIVKAHPMHAGTSCLVAEIVLNAAKKFDLPNGVFSHIISHSHIHGTLLVNHPKVNAVGFTGSIAGGRALMDLAAKRTRPIPVFAEMGSINPVVFFEDELQHNFNHWVSKFVNSIANDAGQFCTKPGLLFVPNSAIGNQFIDLLSNELRNREPLPQLHPAIHQSFKKQCSELFDWPVTVHENYSQPILRVIQSQQFKEDNRFRNEFFGPQSIAVRFDSETELLDCLALIDGQLTATIIGTTKELRHNDLLIESLKFKAGRIIVNGVPTGVSVCEAMVHGGSYPASSDNRFTAVGIKSASRFTRPIAIQTAENT